MLNSATDHSTSSSMSAGQLSTSALGVRLCRYQFEHSNVNFVRLDYKITNDYIGYYSLWSKGKRSMV